MENNNGQPITTVDEQIKYHPDGKETTTTTKTVLKGDDGSTHYTEHVQVRRQSNQINVADSLVTGTKNIEAGADDERYVKSITYKGELAVLREENHLIEMLKLSSLEVILRLMNTTLKDFCYDISFGIYSSEEIQEFRKSITTKAENKVDDYVKDYDYIIEPDEKMLLPSFFNEEIFESVHANKFEAKFVTEIINDQEIDVLLKKAIGDYSLVSKAIFSVYYTSIAYTVIEFLKARMYGIFRIVKNIVR